jgi:hypothetical protein
MANGHVSRNIPHMMLQVLEDMVSTEMGRDRNVLENDGFCDPWIYVLKTVCLSILSAVNSVAWAPHELGPLLACASSDGRVSVLSFNGNVLRH